MKRTLEVINRMQVDALLEKLRDRSLLIATSPLRRRCQREHA